jgi:hypothetical protein
MSVRKMGLFAVLPSSTLLTSRGCKFRFALELLGLQATKAIDALLFNNLLGYWIRNACRL